MNSDGVFQQDHPGTSGQTLRPTEYDRHQAELQERVWRLTDQQFYHDWKKEPDPFYWHNVDYLDVYADIYGRRCGSAGIGRLREVGLVRVSEDDVYSDHPYFKEDPKFLSRDGFLQTKPVDKARLADQQAAYAGVLEEHGVKVYWIEYPERPMAAFGPMTNQHSASELTILPGGSIIPKKGYALAPLSGFGRTEYLARWAFWNLGVPVLMTVTGKAVWVQGLFLADDVYVHTLGIETNQAGLDQVLPVIRSVCGDELTVRVIRTPGIDYFDRHTGTNAHTDMIIGAVDLGKLVAYGPSIDNETHRWLRDAGFVLIDVPLNEQVDACACNLVVLEPRLVVMHAGASETIAQVRKLGVEVIPVDYSEYNQFGGGIHCATMQILRDAGPRLHS
jgi:N-dimethylarginine dimethylaminohydrolase